MKIKKRGVPVVVIKTIVGTLLLTARSGGIKLWFWMYV